MGPPPSWVICVAVGTGSPPTQESRGGHEDQQLSQFPNMIPVPDPRGNYFERGCHEGAVGVCGRPSQLPRGGYEGDILALPARPMRGRASSPDIFLRAPGSPHGARTKCANVPLIPAARESAWPTARGMRNHAPLILADFDVRCAHNDPATNPSLAITAP